MRGRGPDLLLMLGYLVMAHNCYGCPLLPHHRRRIRCWPGWCPDDIADGFAQSVQVPLLEVNAVHEHVSDGWVIEPRDELGEGTFRPSAPSRRGSGRVRGKSTPVRRPPSVAPRPGPPRPPAGPAGGRGRVLFSDTIQSRTRWEMRMEVRPSMMRRPQAACLGDLRDGHAGFRRIMGGPPRTGSRRR